MKGVLFHQDNAPTHKSVFPMAAVRDCGFELVDHPPYSPDLAPSDYFLFPKMKKKTHLAGKYYWPMMKSYLQLRTFLRIRMRAYYATWLQVLQHRWKNCEDGRGDYADLVKFDHCIIVSLWTFQPTLIHAGPEILIIVEVTMLSSVHSYFILRVLFLSVLLAFLLRNLYRGNTLYSGWIGI